MTGGSASVGRTDEFEAHEAHETHEAPLVLVDRLDDDDLAPPRIDWRTRGFAVLAFMLAIGWLTAFALAEPAMLGNGLTVARAVSLIVGATPPLVLIGVLYLLVVRTSRSEAGRFAQVSVGLRAEQARLEAVFVRVGDTLAQQRVDIADHADRLMMIGDEAGARLNAVGETLRRDIDTLSRQAEALRQSAGAARADTNALLNDLPKAHAETQAMTSTLAAAGLSALERAGALDAQISALVVRGREADEIAGGAAQKLAAHLARIESVSTTAGSHLVDAAGTMTTAIDAALLRAAEAADAARQGMAAQGAAMLALVEQGEAALSRTGAEASEAVERRVADATTRIAALGPLLDQQRATGEAALAGLDDGVGRLAARLAGIDSHNTERNARLGSALAALAQQATALDQALDRGGASADTMIVQVEKLITGLGAAAAELDHDLPVAMRRVDAHADATHVRLATLTTDVGAIERAAGAALDRLIEAETVLTKQRATLDALADDVAERLARGEVAATDLVRAVERADARSTELANGANAQLVAAMVRVRETAQLAAERAREAIEAVIPASAERVSGAIAEALQATLAGEVEAQIVKLSSTADHAVAAAGAASDRLMRQMLTIAETSAQVETRIALAHAEIEAADSDTFARRVALLIESLNSTAIDVTKIMSNEVTDSAWSAYLKGDRGVFTRRAVRLLDASEVREVVKHYHGDGEFREQVNRYIHDFEAMLRNVLATRSGSPMGVTLLSSDMGKLYVALAQAIERLRA